MNLDVGILIPWLPFIAVIFCGICATHRRWFRFAAPICTGAIGLSFVVTVLLLPGVLRLGPDAASHTVTWLAWIHVGDLDVSFAYYFDPLTMIMLLVVTGIGALISLYAAGYMAKDLDYARFFAAVALFVAAMTTLVMADNLVLLFLGWEGVGLCSYLLIGYYFERPEAVAAAKKAFIVNRIGDFGFLLGIFLTFQHYDTLQLSVVLEHARANATLLLEGHFVPSSADLWIPFLLMIGAFGKSAQLPLYVWLPDAMAGPTPVSALIHAATMVTAGVYLIARMLPVFELSPYALPTVAAVGGITALFAATIALCNNDLKGVFAYSTVSQLGYMFLGIGALSSDGAIFHLVTHAMFKGLLFLTAGSVMHALAGQLDIRTMSGLRHRMPVTCWLMFAGCLALAGAPLTSGFYSKDMILADAMAMGLNNFHGMGWLYLAMAWVGVFTALLTAFYTFRLWFTVFMGEERYELGHEHHMVVEDAAHGYEVHEEDLYDVVDEGHGGHGPHEMPWWPMNAPLVVLAVGTIFAGVLFKDTIGTWLADSTANPVAAPLVLHDAAASVSHAADTLAHAATQTAPHAAAAAADHAVNTTAHTSATSGGGHDPHHAEFLGGSVHTTMMLLSGLLALVGIAAAAFFHWINRPLRDRLAEAMGPVVTVLQNKYYVDELYDRVFVAPLRLTAQVCYVLDTLVVHAAVVLIGSVPRLLGAGLRPAQTGRLQGYGLLMALGVALAALLVLLVQTQGR